MLNGNLYCRPSRETSSAGWSLDVWDGSDRIVGRHRADAIERDAVQGCGQQSGVTLLVGTTDGLAGFDGDDVGVGRVLRGDVALSDDRHVVVDLRLTGEEGRRVEDATGACGDGGHLEVEWRLLQLAYRVGRNEDGDGQKEGTEAHQNARKYPARP